MQEFLIVWCPRTCINIFVKKAIWLVTREESTPRWNLDAVFYCSNLTLPEPLWYHNCQVRFQFGFGFGVHPIIWATAGLMVPLFDLSKFLLLMNPSIKTKDSHHTFVLFPWSFCPASFYHCSFYRWNVLFLEILRVENDTIHVKYYTYVCM